MKPFWVSMAIYSWKYYEQFFTRQLALSWQKFHQHTPHKCHWCGKKDNWLHQMWDHLARVHAWVGEAERADPFWKEPADPFGERYRPRFQTPLHNPLTSSIATQQVTSLPPAPAPLRPWGCSWGTGCLLHQWAKKQLGIAHFPGFFTTRGILWGQGGPSSPNSSTPTGHPCLTQLHRALSPWCLLGQSWQMAWRLYNLMTCN